MRDAVAVAIISGGLALLGVIITSISTSRRMTAQLERNPVSYTHLHGALAMT